MATFRSSSLSPKSLASTVLANRFMTNFSCPCSPQIPFPRRRYFASQAQPPQSPAPPIQSLSPCHPIPSSSFQFKVQSSQDLCTRIESTVETLIRPLSINELLSFHTGNHRVTTTNSDAAKDQTTATETNDTIINLQQQEEKIDSNDSNASSDCNQAEQPISSPLSIQSSTITSSRLSWESILLRSASWAREEISVRLAHRLYDFSRLPFVVVSNPHVFDVYQLYVEAFNLLSDFGEVKNLEDEDRFTEQLKSIVTAHGKVVALMQKGILSLKQNHKNGDLLLDKFLDRLFGTRIGNRVLAETHLALHDHPEVFDDPSFTGPIQPTLGVIHRRCKPSEVLKDVALKVQQVSCCAYGIYPEVSLGGELDLVFPYIPEHLRFVCFEILKNSVRATVEHQLETASEGPLPPVHVGIHKGEAHVVIKVTDEGGGLDPELHDAIWQYGFSTVSSSRDGKSKSSSTHQKHMAGYGFGLPLSRLYSRYWGGNLDIKFMPGYGTDTYIFLPRLGNQRESEEMLNNCLYDN